MNLPAIFKDASLNQQHAIIHEVFKEDLTYQGGTFTTPSINPMFAHNLLKLKELGLLDFKQPSDNSDVFSSCGEGGIRTLDTLLKYTHFPGVLFRPLRHLSVFWSANVE